MASTGRNTTFILLIILSIVVFLFLNMVLGSVRIPMSAVWHIFTGTGDEPQTWQNIIWKSRFPQALTALAAVGYPILYQRSVDQWFADANGISQSPGRTFCIRNQLRSQYGSCFRRTFFR